MKEILLIVIPHCSTGGMPQFVLKKIELLLNYYEIYIIEYNQITVKHVLHKNKIKNLIKNDHYFTLSDDKSVLLNYIKVINPNIIHFEEFPETFVDENLCKSIYKNDREYKIFETHHGSNFDISNKKFFPDKVILVSEYYYSQLNELNIPVSIIEYPINFQQISSIEKEEALSKLNLNPEYKHILNVGLFNSNKNQKYAFEIANELKNEKIKFHFVGNQADNYKPYWEPLMKNKPENCIIWGEIDSSDFYKSCDLFLFTSKLELNPLVIKEALSYNMNTFLFNLSIYNNRYSENKLCHYLSENVKTDANNIINYLKYPKKNRSYVSMYNDNTVMHLYKYLYTNTQI